MAKARSWYVESKEFEMLIKGGNYGLRIVERSKKRRGSIFIKRDEIAWLVGAVEEVLVVESSKVYWDPSSAGFPRVLVQRRSNRHEGFIFIEEFEGNKRRGSILVPEGRYGQGWSRLASELRIARLTLWEDRVFRERKAARVVAGRSFAAVVGRPKPIENVLMAVSSEMVEDSTKIDEGRVKLHTQTTSAYNPKKVDTQKGLPKGCVEEGGYTGGAPAKSQFLAMEVDGAVSEKVQVQNLPIVETGGCVGGAPVKLQSSVLEKNGEASAKSQAACCVNETLRTLSKELQNPVLSRVAAPKGGFGSEGVGRSSVHVGVELQDFKKCLLDIRGQLDLGMKRVDWAFHLLEKMQRGCGESPGEMGLGTESQWAEQHMDREVVGWSKPKRRNFKRFNKPQPGLVGSKPEGLLGPKPDKMPIQLTQRSGPEKSFLTPKPIGLVTKPSFEKAQATQTQGDTKRAQLRTQARRSLQKTHQEGESSEMGAQRAIGVKGTLLAGDASGEHPPGTGELPPGTGELPTGVGSSMGADLAGEFIDGTGLSEKLTPASGDSGSENAEGLGCDSSSPVMVLSTFPERAGGLGCDSSSPVMVLSTFPESLDLGVAPSLSVKRSKHMFVGSESADEVGTDILMPEKQPKQLKVFQKSESRGEGEDKLWWVPSRKGLFEVKTYYRVLSTCGSDPFPWKSVWKSKAPPRVAFFVWTAVHSKILTLDNLGRRGLLLVNRYWLCETDGESVDHLFIHCGVARDLWNAFFARFGLCWVMPRTVKELLASWWTAGRTRSAVVWKMVHHCILWCIWRERNDRCFEDSPRTREELLHLFLVTLFSWTSGWLAPRAISFVDFLTLFSFSP
jgi:hypothetical protein